MRTRLIIPIFILSFNFTYAQSLNGEKVEWMNPQIFKAKSFTFKTDSVEFDMKNCKIMEIKSESGISGYYLEGNGNIHIASKEFSEQCVGAMIRFNPSERDTMISTQNLKPIKDDEFINKALHVLRDSFKHCYHSGMNALIPEPGYYAINFFSDKIGEVLVSRDINELIFYNFTIRSKM